MNGARFWNWFVFFRGSRAFSFLLDPVMFFFLICLVHSDSLASDFSCEGLDVRYLFSLDLGNIF